MSARQSVRWRNAGYGLYLAVVNWMLNLPGHDLRLLVFRRVCRNSVGPGTAIERGIRVTSKGGVVIGSGCNINRGAVLDGRGGLTIGDYVNVSPEVQMLTASHDPDAPHFSGFEASIEVGDRCWLATLALVLPGVIVGEGAVVAAGAVVTHSVPPWTIVGGNPAEVLRRRSQSAQRTLPEYRRWFH